jgi:hypothetical protein
MKILLLLFFYMEITKGEKIYYRINDEYEIPDQLIDPNIYGNVVFSDYDQNGDYVVIVDTIGYALYSYINTTDYDDNIPRIGFYISHYYCIKPETAIKAPNDVRLLNNINNYLGERDENCDCSKFQFDDFKFDTRGNYYNINHQYSKNSFNGKCAGYKKYTLAELKTFKGKFRFK